MSTRNALVEDKSSLPDNPIEYWANLGQCKHFHRHFCMALDLFSTPAMSSEVERIFSLAGLMVVANRSRLTAETIGATHMGPNGSCIDCLGLNIEVHGIYR